MPDRTPFTPRTAFDDGRSPIGVDASPDLVIVEQTGWAIASVLGGRENQAALVARASAVYGAGLPERPERVVSRDVSFLGIGPRRWLAIRPECDGGEWSAELARTFGELASVVDQSDAFGVIGISGRLARDVLAKGLPIDLHPRVFSPQGVVATLIAHVGVTVWQADLSPTYAIAVPRSFAGSFRHWLTASAAEFNRT